MGEPQEQGGLIDKITAHWDQVNVTRCITVPEWGGVKLYYKPITVAEDGIISRLQMANLIEEANLKTIQLKAEDENGEPLLQPAHIRIMLRRSSREVVMRLARMISNNLSDADEAPVAGDAADPDGVAPSGRLDAGQAAKN